MRIQLQGQLQSTAGVSGVEVNTADGETLADVMERVAMGLPESARALMLDDAGDLRSSLFVAVDGVHTRDFSQPADGDEVLLMPPMAGG